MSAKPVAGFAAVVVACLVLEHAAGAIAAPLEWPLAEGGNGHFYEYVTAGPPLPWDTALVQAADRTYGGVSGHLATLTSEPEWRFVVSRLDDIQRQAWIGGRQAPGSWTPSQGWYWITGEPWDFAPWGEYVVGPEPNDFGGISGEDGWEDYLALFGHAFGPGTGGNPNNYGMFNDEKGNGTSVSGYIVEYAVPEPGSATLLAASALIALRRRRPVAAPPIQ